MKIIKKNINFLTIFLAIHITSNYALAMEEYTEEYNLEQQFQKSATSLHSTASRATSIKISTKATPFAMQDIAHLVNDKGPKKLCQTLCPRQYQQFLSNPVSTAWTMEELLQNIFTQRLQLSSQEVKDFTLQSIARLYRLEYQYIAACCIAAGANPELACGEHDSFLIAGIEGGYHGFVQTILPFKPNPNRAYNTEYYYVDVHKQKIFRTISVPAFFVATDVAMSKLLKEMGANYELKGGISGSTILHHLCRGTFDLPIESELTFYLENGANPSGLDDRGRTPLLMLGKHLAKPEHEHKLNCAFILLSFGASLYAKDLQGKTILDYVDSDTAEQLKSKIKKILTKQKGQFLPKIVTSLT